MTVGACLLDGDPHGVDAAHLTGADPDRRKILDQHDRVRADVLADPPREDQIAPLRFGRRPARDLPALAVLDLPVAVLHEHSAEHSLVVALRRLAAAPLLVAEDPRARFLPQRRERLVVEARCVEHLDELLRELAAELSRDGPCQDDDAAVRRGRIGG